MDIQAGTISHGRLAKAAAREYEEQKTMDQEGSRVEYGNDNRKTSARKLDEATASKQVVGTGTNSPRGGASREASGRSDPRKPVDCLGRKNREACRAWGRFTGHSRLIFQCYGDFCWPAQLATGIMKHAIEVSPHPWGSFFLRRSSHEHQR